MHGMDDRTRRQAMPRWAALAGASLILASACASTSPPSPSTAARPSPSIASVESPAPAPSDAAPQLAPSSRTQAVIDYLVTRVAEDPTDPDARLELGLALLQRIRETADPSLYAPAEAALRAARRLLPTDPEALIGLGGLQLGRHRFAEALETGRAAVRLAPRSTGAGAIVVDALIELGQYDEAFDAAESLARGSPDLASLSRLSYARELRGDIDGAIDAMRGALGSPGVAPENTAFAWSIVGHLERLAGDPDAARSAYEEALDLEPNHAPSFAGLGRLAISEGDLAEAAAEFERAAAVLPLPEYVIALGEINEITGDTQAARRQYDTARAEIVLFQAAGVAVDIDLALFECDHGDPSKGRGFAQTAYASMPTIRAADALAWCLHRSGDDETADVRADEALRLGSRDPLLLYHAGAIALAIGDVDTARDRLTAAIELDAGFSATGAADARRLLDRLAGN
jgi:tetratricopeptide (TPR) repeat protein